MKSSNNHVVNSKKQCHEVKIVLYRDVYKVQVLRVSNMILRQTEEEKIQGKLQTNY